MADGAVTSMSDVDPSRLIFIGGLHRSGTTALGRVLAEHPQVSGFSGTGATEDEGQHLQTIYPAAQTFGGPGRFARSTAAHLGPAPDGRRAADRDGLLSAWMPHWDLSKPLLVEKSPPNLIMGRYLQSVFPGSALIVILRHPVIVALSTKKWRRETTIGRLVEHWFIAHDRFRADFGHLERVHVLHYEDLVHRTGSTLEGLTSFLGLGSPLDSRLIQSSRSDSYLRKWDEMSSGSLVSRVTRRRIEKRFAAPATQYGYDISDVATLGESCFSSLAES